MKERIQNIIKQISTWQKQNFFASPFHIVLIIAVGVLIVAAFMASLTSNEGSSSVKKLKLYLQELLKLDLMSLKVEDETYKLEKLINQVKVTCEKKVICGDHELWVLLDNVCKKVSYIMDYNEIPDRNRWRLFRAIALEFQNNYGPEHQSSDRQELLYPIHNTAREYTYAN